MARIVVPRLWQLVVTMWLVTVVVFIVVRLAPGDPAKYQLGVGHSFGGTEEMLAAIRHDMGLDKPIPVQYVIWMRRVLVGDLGQSLRNKRPVLDVILEKLPASIELMVGSVAMGLLVGVPLGCLAAFKRGTWVDSVTSFVVLLGMAMPVFWLGLLLIMLFSVQLRILPPGGRVSFLEDPVANLRQLAMPALSIGVYEIALFARYARSEMLGVLGQDYIRTAYAKGLTATVVVRRHALPNALMPIITILGLQVAHLISGTAVVEQVFGWSGVGWIAVQAINNRDYPVVQGIVLLSAVVFSVANTAVDIAYTVVNPKIRYG